MRVTFLDVDHKNNVRMKQCLKNFIVHFKHFSGHIVPAECEKYDILYLLISLSKLFRIRDILK